MGSQAETSGRLIIQKKTRKRRRFLMTNGQTPEEILESSLESMGSVLPARPRVRSECQSGPRPCPWVGCRYHLYLDLYTTGDPAKPVPGLIIHHSDKEPTELRDTCLLDLAGRGPLTLAEIGEIFDLSRERVRQIESSALRKLHRMGVTLDDGSLARILERD